MKRSWLFIAVIAGCASLAWCSGFQTAPPLHIKGYLLIDSSNHPVRLVSANWYGFDQQEFVAGGLDHAPLGNIVKQIQNIGLNSIRLPWSNEMLERNPIVPDYAVSANPEFKGKHALEVMDAVIDALAKAHIMIVLDNHVSRADWCCSETDGNGLWYSDAYPERNWLADWETIVRRYKNQPWIIGADLRNEPRSGATWGGNTPELDWHAAAERAGKTILDVNSNLLIIVESPDWSRDFRKVADLPVKLPVPNRLVYSPHAYNDSYGPQNERFEERAGFLMHHNPAVPIWIGEFGTCQTMSCDGNSDWFRIFTGILRQNKNISWSYWALNGAQSSGRSRKYDAVETYGLLGPDYHTIASKLAETLRLIGAQSKK